MSTVRARIDPSDPGSLPEGRIDHAVLDSTTESDLALQQDQDDAEAMQDTARYARRIRKRLGLTQIEFARRIDVPHENDPQLGAGEALPDRRRESLAKDSRQGPPSRLSAH